MCNETAKCSYIRHEGKKEISSLGKFPPGRSGGRRGRDDRSRERAWEYRWPISDKIRFAKVLSAEEKFYICVPTYMYIYNPYSDISSEIPLLSMDIMATWRDIHIFTRIFSFPLAVFFSSRSNSFGLAPNKYLTQLTAIKYLYYKLRMRRLYERIIFISYFENWRI